MGYEKNPMPALRSKYLDALLETSISKTWGELLKMGLVGELTPGEMIEQYISPPPEPTTEEGLPFTLKKAEPITAPAFDVRPERQPVEEPAPVPAPAPTPAPAPAPAPAPPKKFAVGDPPPKIEDYYEPGLDHLTPPAWNSYVIDTTNWANVQLTVGGNISFEVSGRGAQTNKEAIDAAIAENAMLEQQRQEHRQQYDEYLSGVKGRNEDVAIRNRGIHTGPGIVHAGTGVGFSNGMLVSAWSPEVPERYKPLEQKYAKVPAAEYEEYKARISAKKPYPPQRGGSTQRQPKMRQAPFTIGNQVNTTGTTWIDKMTTRPLDKWTTDITATQKDLFANDAAYHNALFNRDYNMYAAKNSVYGVSWIKPNFGGKKDTPINKLYNGASGGEATYLESGLIELANAIITIQNGKNHPLHDVLMDNGLVTALYAVAPDQKGSANRERIIGINSAPNNAAARERIAKVLRGVFRVDRGNNKTDTIKEADIKNPDRRAWIVDPSGLSSTFVQGIYQFWRDYVERVPILDDSNRQITEFNVTNGSGTYDKDSQIDRIAEGFALQTILLIIQKIR